MGYGGQMIDPKPLFDGEDKPRPAGALDFHDDASPRVAAAAPGSVSGSASVIDVLAKAPLATGIEVAPLTLTDVPARPALQPAGIAVRPVGLYEDPGLAQAIARGTEKFPAVMRESGFLVRNSLNQLLPLDFDKLSVFGGATLQRVASLIGELTELNARLHEIDAERIIAHVVDAARAHAARRRQTSILGLLGELVPFDATAAEIQVTAVHQALLRRLEQVASISDAMLRLRATLVVEVTTLAILDDMSDHGAMGDQLARRSLLFTTSLQEVATACSQIESLKKQLQDWTMRCDEVRTITLPALGYTGSF